MHFDRFDIAEAWYLYLSEYHEGQWSEKYERLSKLLKYFNPRHSLNGAENLSANGQEIYAAIVDKHEGGVKLWVSLYGDGAILDASLDGPGKLRKDDSTYEDDDGDEHQEPTAIIKLTGCPTLTALDCVAYANGNNGPRPYRDGYEACACLGEAKESKVLECSVPWDTETCERLSGCFLCGGKHDF